MCLGRVPVTPKCSCSKSTCRLPQGWQQQKKLQIALWEKPFSPKCTRRFTDLLLKGISRITPKKIGNYHILFLRRVRCHSSSVAFPCAAAQHAQCIPLAERPQNKTSSARVQHFVIRVRMPRGGSFCVTRPYNAQTSCLSVRSLHSGWSPHCAYWKFKDGSEGSQIPAGHNEIV